MANRKVVTRVQIDAEEIRNAIKVRGSNISELASTIGWSRKSIHRALKTGEMNLDLYMDIHKWMDPNSKMEVTVKRERPEDTKTNMMVEGLESRVADLREYAITHVRSYMRLLDMAEDLRLRYASDPLYNSIIVRTKKQERKTLLGAYMFEDMLPSEEAIWDDLIEFLENLAKKEDHHAGDEGKE